ncbi:MAG: class I SAM-dependent methyltransferase [Bacteroidota bacterium]
MDKNKHEDIYKTTPLKDIPWNKETPPEALVELIETGAIKPCKAIDMGCGAGNYAVYIAEQGFEVTGVDQSVYAINIARENAAEKGVNVRFIAADITGNFNEINETFDFVYDWGVLHHIFPGDRKNYVKNVNRILNAGGKYLSVCFSVEDDFFEGKGKYRTTKRGNSLYFSTEEEMKELFEPHFHINELKTIEIFGKSVSHQAVYVFMEKG